MHLVTLLAAAALVLAAARAGAALSSKANYTPTSFVLNVAMVHALRPEQAWNLPAWSISAEWFAYLAFPLVAAVVVRTRSAMVALLVAAVALYHVVEEPGRRLIVRRRRASAATAAERPRPAGEPGRPPRPRDGRQTEASTGDVSRPWDVEVRRARTPTPRALPSVQSRLCLRILVPQR